MSENLRSRPGASREHADAGSLDCQMHAEGLGTMEPPKLTAVGDPADFEDLGAFDSWRPWFREREPVEPSGPSANPSSGALALRALGDFEALTTNTQTEIDTFVVGRPRACKVPTPRPSHPAPAASQNPASARPSRPAMGQLSLAILVVRFVGS